MAGGPAPVESWPPVDVLDAAVAAATNDPDSFVHTVGRDLYPMRGQGAVPDTFESTLHALLSQAVDPTAPPDFSTRESDEAGWRLTLVHEVGRRLVGQNTRHLPTTEQQTQWPPEDQRVDAAGIRDMPLARNLADLLTVPDLRRPQFATHVQELLDVHVPADAAVTGSLDDYQHAAAEQLHAHLYALGARLVANTTIHAPAPEGV